MTKNTNVRLVIGALNLLAVSAPMTAVAQPATQEHQRTEQINMASLASIESTWLQVPMVCKARGFNANATSLESNQVSASITALYASYQA